MNKSNILTILTFLSFICLLLSIINFICSCKVYEEGIIVQNKKGCLIIKDDNNRLYQSLNDHNIIKLYNFKKGDKVKFNYSKHREYVYVLLDEYQNLDIKGE